MFLILGAPTEGQTYEYAKTILSLMTKEKHEKGKVLIIGGGIANFTNVAKTFKGIIRALLEFREALIKNQTSIFVRRAGPNYQEGLRRMKEIGQNLGKNQRMRSYTNLYEVQKQFLVLIAKINQYFRYTFIRIWPRNTYDSNSRNGSRY